jgi:hypothetical protein
MTKPKMRRAVDKDGNIDWLKQTRFDYHFAKTALLSQGSVAPMYIVHSRNGIIPILATYNDGAQKNAVHNVVRMFCIAEDADAVGYIGEAWSAKAMPEDAAHPDRPTVMPKDREDRMEVVVCQIIYRGLDGPMGTFMQGEIDRDTSGKAVGLINEMSAQSHQIGGSFADLLPPRRPTPAEQQAARTLLKMFQQHGGMQQFDDPAGRA